MTSCSIAFPSYNQTTLAIRHTTAEYSMSSSPGEQSALCLVQTSLIFWHLPMPA